MSAIEDLSSIRPDLRSSYGTSTNLALNEKIKSLIASGHSISHFAFGQSPFPVPTCMVDALKTHAPSHEYLSVAGLQELRDGIVKFHKRHDEVELNQNNIIVAPGSKELIYLIMTTFVGDVIIPSPAWVTYEPQVKLAGKTAIIPTSDRESGYKITPEILEEVLTGNVSSKRYLLILNNPGNPTGTCYTPEELLNLSHFCRKRNIIVLSDEIYARLVFKRNHESIMKYYPEGTILASGFSKWASAGGWRLGYVHFPDELQALGRIVRNAGSHTYSCAPSPMQHAIAQALNNNMEELNLYLMRCTRILEVVSNYCYRELHSVGVVGHPSQAGYYYVADFEVIRSGLKKRGILTGPQMTEVMLKEADVALMSLSHFLRPKNELTTRFCFVCFDGQPILKDIQINDISLDDEETLEQLVRNHCQTLVTGIANLKSWVVKHRNL